MDRRSFLKCLGMGAVIPFIPGMSVKAEAGDAGRMVFLQNSRVAGTAYYECDRVWKHLRTGDELTLAREPKNQHDYMAIEVRWRGRKLGYVPQLENPTPCILMDQGSHLSGKIKHLREYESGHKGIEMNIMVAVSSDGVDRSPCR